ncbi:MAG: hypothetical protein RDV48_04340 [Candidatus Eremiobacteraeota bacterium]|nr:hypothetical protein [Candidatus Eremiobacteraeota bacterium]
MSLPHRPHGKKSFPARRLSAGSILLVLLVSSLLLVVILALGTLSSINLNLVRAQVEYRQALFTAQAAAAQLIYELDQYETEHSNAVDLASTTFSTLDLRKRYDEKPPFPEGPAVPAGAVTITFDPSRKYYSTDNSQGEYPCRGWKDREAGGCSVPACSIDLIIGVSVGGSTRYFEAIINRKWPYAAFCSRAPIFIQQAVSPGQPDWKWPPTVVKGDVLSLYNYRALRASLFFPGARGAALKSGSPRGVRSPSGIADFYGILGINLLPKASVSIGTRESEGNSLRGNACTSASKEASSDETFDSSAFDPIQVSPGNVFTGRKCYGIAQGLCTENKDPLSQIVFPELSGFSQLRPESISELEEVGTGDNAFTMQQGYLTWVGSKKKAKAFEQKVNEYCELAKSNPSLLPPELMSQLGLDSQSSSALHSAVPDFGRKEVIERYLIKIMYGSACFLKSTLTLEGDAHRNKFYLKGDLSNHYVIYDRKWKPAQGFQGSLGSSSSAAGSGKEELVKIGERFSGAGLVLKDCTLFVDGDVELSEYEPGSLGQAQSMGCSLRKKLLRLSSSPSSIVGTNATLVVSGNLKITGGSLDSRDRGMVIHAKNMEFATKGTYQGLIIGQGAIVINPSLEAMADGTWSPSGGLTVKGAIASRGAVLDEDGEEATSSAGSLALKGLSLNSVNLTFDTRYVKSLHRFGRPRIAVWNEIQ